MQTEKPLLKKYTCANCDHIYQTRSRKPRCPNCHSRRWVGKINYREDRSKPIELPEEVRVDNIETIDNDVTTLDNLIKTETPIDRSIKEIKEILDKQVNTNKFLKSEIKRLNSGVRFNRILNAVALSIIFILTICIIYVLF